MRTLFNWTSLAVLVFSQSAVADVRPPAVPNPIKDVTPYVEKDKTSVIAFYRFGCPACRMFHTSLSAWGKSLPKGISFQFYPVVEPGDGHDISNETMLGLQTFWVAERIGTPAQREAFAAEAYSLVQDEKQGSNRDRWFDALLSQGLSRQSIVTAWKAEIELGSARYERQAHYRPTNTPSLVICGKWMISPDSANGDPNLFAQLANGLVSQCADGMGITSRR
ncbi:MAG: hypothetical protein PHQ60_02090 [Sideroxydans sp.]|nr:hypothetical protein [Sideroxydans sp.]MDD5056633.1 hypothetical protein [Sideroxydans sp.]